MAVGVEAHAEPLEVAHPRRRLLAQHAHGARAVRRRARRRACPAMCSSGRVVVGERRGDPALGPVTTPSARAASGDTSATARPRVGGRQGGVEARRRRRRRPRRRLAAGPDGAHRPVPYRRACPSTSAIPSSLEHDTGSGHPERAERITAIEAELAARATGSASSGARRRRRRPSSCWRCTRPGYVDARPRDLRARRGPSTSTRRPRPAPGRRRCTPPAAPARWSRRCSAGSGRLLGAAPARPPRRARARDGLLPVRQRRDRRAARARLARRRARAGARLGRAPRQRHQRRSSTSRREVLFASIHQYPFYPGTGALTDVGAGRRRGLLDQPAGAGRARARTSSAGWSSTWCCRRRARSTPTSCSSRPATTRIATTRSAAARSRPRSYGELARQVR